MITYTAVGGIWRDPVDNVPGSQPADPVITNGNPTSIIVWGDTMGTPQSGYDFTATVPPPFTLPGPIPFFSLGSFTHRNFEVDDPSLTSVQLDVVLVISVDGVPRPPLTFTFTFNHEETPNNLMPCPYPTPPGEGCTDRVKIVASPSPTTFNVDGIDYTLSMSFLNNGNPVSEFITREGGTINSSGLVGQFTLPNSARHAGADGRQVGPGDDESCRAGRLRARRAEHRHRRRVQRDVARSAAEWPDGRHVRHRAADRERARVRRRRRDAGAGQRPADARHGLLVRLERRRVRAHARTLTAASVIGVAERLDRRVSHAARRRHQYGAALTNVAGATQWFNAASSNPGRLAYTRTLTNGTVGTVDHEDAHTVTLVPRLYADKAAALQVDGSSPGIVDAGDVLRYTIRDLQQRQLAADASRAARRRCRRTRPTSPTR